ncbi:unnamed protein product [Caenorhabditis nigoni]
MDGETINNNVVTIYKLILFVLGTTGNLLFIHLIYKKRRLRTRSSLLQCAQCAFHCVCLLGTVLGGFMMDPSTRTRQNCFVHISFYIFCQAAQGLIMLIIMADILVSVNYHNLSTWKYTVSVSIPVLIYSSFVVFYGYLTTNEESIHTCNPLFAFSFPASLFQKCQILFLCFVTTAIYIILIKMFHKMERSQNDDSLKIMKRLQFSVIIFIFTWLVSQVVAIIFLRDGAMVKTERMIFAHNSVFIALSYSNTFYVTMWKSEEYRKQFLNVWRSKKTVPTKRPNTLPSL